MTNIEPLICLGKTKKPGIFTLKKPCLHPVEHVVINQAGTNMVSGYCLKCFNMVTFGTPSILKTLDKLLNN